MPTNQQRVAHAAHALNAAGMSVAAGVGPDGSAWIQPHGCESVHFPGCTLDQWMIDRIIELHRGAPTYRDAREDGAP